MKRGGKFIGTAAMLSIAACSGGQGKLQIRTSAAPLAAGHQAVPFRIAEARGHLAMGNVALALEAFRKALREEPSSIEAMMGVAACYDRMARFDLSRRHYESALAIAPGNIQLLGTFAGSLDLQGRKAEAASVRAEIHQRIALAAQKSAPLPAAVPTLPSHSVEIALAGQARPAKAAPRSISVERAPVPLPIPVLAETPIQSAMSLPASTPSPRAVATPPAGRSVTIALPPARPVTQAPPAKRAVQSAASPVLPPARPTNAQPPAKPAVEVTAKAPLPPARPVTAQLAKPVVELAAMAPIPPARPVIAPPPARPAVESAAAIPPARPVTAPAATPAVAPAAEKIARAKSKVLPETVAENTGPRLERTSLREVALITTPGPQWRALTVKRTQRSATVRFVPLRQASINLSNIRLLNAARVNRLAARTRSYLVGRGWSPMAIGDAPAVRARSVIFYPPERRRTAQTLSAQFGFVMKPRPGSRQIIVLLGRDAARVSALRASG